jgi:threonyl-tRNA synthetase
VRIISLNDDLVDHIRLVQAKLRASGIRASVDGHSDKLSAKIRRAEVEKIPHMFIVGPKEAETGTVSVRSRIDSAFLGTMDLGDAIAHLKKSIATRELPTDNFR